MTHPTNRIAHLQWSMHSQLPYTPLQQCIGAKFKLRALRHLRHSRKPIATRFQHKTATRARDSSDFVTTVTQRVVKPPVTHFSSIPACAPTHHREGYCAVCRAPVEKGPDWKHVWSTHMAAEGEHADRCSHCDYGNSRRKQFVQWHVDKKHTTGEKAFVVCVRDGEEKRREEEEWKSRCFELHEGVTG